MSFKINYQFNNGLSIEIEASDQKDAFDQLSALGNVFSISECGKCGSNDIRFFTKTVDKFTYRHMICNKCWSQLAFGVHQNESQTLFPKYTKDGETIANKGWTKYNKNTGKNE